MANEIISGMGFHHIGLKSADFEKSLKFYEALGMKCLARWGSGAKSVAMLDLGDGGRIELFGDGGDAFSANGKWVHFAVKVADVDAAYAKALEIGAKSQLAPITMGIDTNVGKMNINIAFVVGTEGEVIEFFREI
jgi:catechol 2,3-dioxygenase-like lactoylglutathione lyase family enzyme